MLTVFFSPHSQSTDNATGRASGHADVPLSAHGEQVAQQLGEQYQQKMLHTVFCSDLQRAHKTGQIAFSDINIPIIRDARLREFDYGELTQCPTEELALKTRINDPFPGGESISMAVQRVGDFLRDMAREYDGKTIVVIGHVATKYGLEYWSSNDSLEDIVNRPWEWRDIPIWDYQFDNPLKRSK
jgi:broad specificity phosphatase PhoE